MELGTSSCLIWGALLFGTQEYCVNTSILISSIHIFYFISIYFNNICPHNILVKYVLQVKKEGEGKKEKRGRGEERKEVLSTYGFHI